MSDTNIAVITPCVTENGSNLHISYSNDSVKTAIVKHSDSDKFILMNKNGGVPDIELDSKTVNLIIRAKMMYDVLTEITEYFRKSNSYSDDILNDKKVIMTILNEYCDTIANGNAAPDIETTARHCIDAQRYRV